MSTNAIKQLWTKAPAARLMLLGLILFVALFVLFIYAFLHQAGHVLAGLAFGQTVTPLMPPPNFQPVAEVDLSSRAYDSETLAQFTLDEMAVTSVYLAIQDIDTAYFNLSLVGPDGDSFVILHGEDFRTDRDGGGLWERNLPPGTYRLVLTSYQSPGVFSVYWGYRSQE